VVEVQDFQPDASLLRELVTTVMPYGKYQGRTIADIPEHYLVWLAGRGFPHGKLGQLLALMYEIRLNGLEGLLQPLQGQRQHFH
jgi:uncharacterized protein (DUF3820 family)